MFFQVVIRFVILNMMSFLIIGAGLWQGSFKNFIPMTLKNCSPKNGF